VDVALVHVDVQLPDIYHWADMDHLTNGSVVVGFGMDPDPRWKEACFAGRVLGVKRTFEHATMVRHDMPLRHGDSGGPVVTPDGKLVGVESETFNQVFAFKSYEEACRPDPSWIEKVIEEDRRQHAGAAAATQP
jgi:hypothetical protein